MVVAKGLGDDRRGHAQHVLADGCAASGDDGNSELVDEGGDVPGMQWLVGAAAGV
ncbi:hypothetical protein [Streptomyces sp. NPDC058579]|uniref:hypothetical protein n=1 Tax=Streptomyces sp. NPDC058579 TaxID=3346548 RepID=UPI003666EC56